MNDIDPTLPEEVQRFLKSGARLESIRLNAMGKWTHEGLDFENKRIIDLFHRSVKKTSGGTWILKVGPYVYPIEVERWGYFVTRFTKTEKGIMLKTTKGKQEKLDITTLRYEEPNTIYCKLEEGFHARFIGSAYINFADLIEEKKGSLFFENHKLT